VLTRRQLMAAGTAAAAWRMGGHRAAHAAGPPIRLVVFPLLNGAEPRFFWPNPGNLGAMSLVTEPLSPFQNQITFVRGIDVTGSFNHMAVRSMFTGAAVPDYLSPDPTVKSVDQVMADHVAATSPTKLRSLHLGVIPADSIQLYQQYGRSTFFFAPRPVDYEANPVSAFDRTFRGQSGPPAPAPRPAPVPGAPPAPAPAPMPMPAAPASFDNEVLDIAEAELTDLTARLRGGSTRELSKLDQHREALRALRPAPVAGGIGPAPAPPPMPNPMNPAPAPPPRPPGGPIPGCSADVLASVEKLRPSLQGKDAAAYRHEFYSDIFDAQIDVLTRAVVCGLTRVATIQAGSADGNVTDPVGPGYPHHNTSHGNQDIFARCQQWYATKFLRLLRGLDVPDPLDPGKTVLHNSLVLLMSECMPVGHESNSVPVLLAGRAGGALRSGSYVDLKSASNKTLMQTVLQLCGVGGGAAPHFGGGIFSELRA
jgi:hypothetical protein